jgi:primosomal replication protein N''
LLEWAFSLSDDELKHWVVLAESATDTTTIWKRINPFRWRKKRRVQSFLRQIGDSPSDDRLGAFCNTLRFESRLRPLRVAINRTRTSLRLPSSQQVSAERLRRELGSLIVLLRPVEVAVIAAMACPRPADAERMARSGAVEAFTRLQRDFEDAIARHRARHASRETLSRLAQWMEPTWIAACAEAISRGASSADLVQGIGSAVRTIEPYQRFRARAQEIDPASLAVFAVLRGRADALRRVPPSSLEKQVRDTIHREALLAWKGRLENASPALLIEQEELQRKVASLAELDNQFRSLNRQLLAADIDPAQLGSQTAWDDILQLRGPRARRLREIFELGGNLGLLKLRPIWLMNPDVASRLLPRRPRLFDVVIYDEASQMLVEHSVPTLFRASRVVISGDEKQMPPTSFFSARVEGDEDEESDGDPLDEAVTEAERAAMEETWNRKEIINCPDLLQLGRGVLPSTTLQVHYRSKYRELIDYSNSAFYRGTLNVPARHPDAEVRRAKPIEVHRVEGTYEGQTNLAEAQKVVELLAGIWSAPPTARPTVGVVTFNRKQADAVEDAIESRAARNVSFLQAYERERERTADGEDVGFFVKNVENVQGDERDVIVFSTTFGLDKNGTFRKNFGVLGQVGGERRLNVAVTRAREKIVLLTSMPIGKISDMLATRQPPARARDYLQGYLDYATKMAAGDLEAGRASADRLGTQDRTRKQSNGHDDGFVRSVASFIRDLGHEAESSAAGDAFALDFAVRDPRTGLFGIGVECDAPRHELLSHARLRELWRPGILARAIPALHRVASHAWYHRPTEERARLRAAIETALSRELS